MAATAVFPTLITPMTDGLVQYGAKAYIFEPGTTTPKPSYTNAALSVENPNPVIVNGVGRFPPIWLGVGNYRVQIRTEAGVVLEDYDDLPGAQPDPVPPPDPPEPGTAVPAGMMMPSTRIDPIEGWVRANGRSIGDAGSGATELQSTRCHDLFVLIWNASPAVTVGGGRGVSAEADWLAGKTVPLPDFRGSAIVGRDSMGSSAAARLTSPTVANPDQQGFRFGAQTIALTSAQNGQHSHTATANSTGQHQHNGSTSDVQGNHVHGYSYATYAAEAVTTASGPGRQTLVMVDDNTDGAGEHGHNLNMIGDGEHTHTITVADSGTGAAHSNVQPSALVTIYIYLGDAT